MMPGRPAGGGVVRVRLLALQEQGHRPAAAPGPADPGVDEELAGRAGAGAPAHAAAEDPAAIGKNRARGGDAGCHGELWAKGRLRPGGVSRGAPNGPTAPLEPYRPWHGPASGT